MKVKQREKGEVFRPYVKVLKVKNGEPTSISFNGNMYALVHPNYINGHKGEVRK
jgi:hypothetical protein